MTNQISHSKVTELYRNINDNVMGFEMMTQHTYTRIHTANLQVKSNCHNPKRSNFALNNRTQMQTPFMKLLSILPFISCLC